jgi:hypothetical protein
MWFEFEVEVLFVGVEEEEVEGGDIPRFISAV